MSGLDKLERLAKAVPPGPWYSLVDGRLSRTPTIQVANPITLPAAILALIARIRELEAAVQGSHEFYGSGHASICIFCLALPNPGEDRIPHKPGCIVETLPKVEDKEEESHETSR